MTIATNTYDLEKVFGLDGIAIKSMTLPKAVDENNIPEMIKDYSFNLEKLNETLNFLAFPNNDCLYISGNAGCGKTSLILQIASRLGWGVESVTLSNKCESLDLVGHSTLKNGELVFEYGALAKAMLYGEILLLNEIDMMSASDLSLLNDVAERKPLTIIQNNGETIMPHPNFRIVCTANSQGNGDETGFYTGARILNQAFLDRFRYMTMDYPTADEEKALVCKLYPAIDTEFVDHLVNFAKNVRDVMKSSLESGVRQLSAPLSTRTILKIAGIYSATPCYTPQKLIDMCYSLRLPSEEREYIQRTVNDVFGHETDEQKQDLGSFTIAKVDLAVGIKVQPKKLNVVKNTKQKVSAPSVKKVQENLDLDIEKDMEFLNNFKVA